MVLYVWVIELHNWMFFSVLQKIQKFSVGALLKSHILYKVFLLHLCLLALSEVLCFCSVVSIEIVKMG